MRKIYLHIGTEKTGTTTIQSFLSKNIARLNEQDFYIPEFLGESHRKITGIAFNSSSSDDLFITECNNSKDIIEKEEKIQSWRNEFQAVAKESQFSNWIISSEFMQSRLRSKDELLFLKNFLGEFFDEIDVILYIRNQINSAASLWSTAVRSGETWLKLPYPGEVSYAFDHQKTINLWSSVLNEKIDVRIFEPEEFIGEDLISDFCNAANIKLDDKFELPIIQNESLPIQGIIALAHINEYVPYIINNGINPSRNNIDIFIKEHFELSKFPNDKFTKEDVYIYEEYYKDSNEWVRKNFFPNKDFLFNPVVNLENDNLPPLTLDDLHKLYTKLISALWLKYN
jgi:hypothetical protein